MRLCIFLAAQAAEPASSKHCEFSTLDFWAVWTPITCTYGDANSMESVKMEVGFPQQQGWKKGVTITWA